MLRNAPVLVVLSLLAMMVGAAGTILWKKLPKTWLFKEEAAGENANWRLAFGLFILGLAGLGWLAGSATRIGKEPPHITASLETTAAGLARVTANVKADGITDNEFIYLRSEGTPRVPTDFPTEGLPLDGNPEAAALLHEAVLGPNAAGSVDATSEFEISPALFQDIWVVASRQPNSAKNVVLPRCISVSGGVASKPAPGCVRLLIPRAPIRPVVSATVSPSGGTPPRALEAKVSAEGVPYASMIVVRAWIGHGGNPLVDQVIGPDVAGNVAASFNVPIPAGPPAACVCLVAALVPSQRHSSRTAVEPDSLCKHDAELPSTVGVVLIRGT